MAHLLLACSDEVYARWRILLGTSLVGVNIGDLFIEAKFAEILFHGALTLSPTPSAPLGHHRLAQCGIAAQIVL
jgi:hypothetical protein